MSLTKEIIDKLFDQYEKHKYMLANSYVYKWESDFFSQLASGYHQEIEVKISRSDFFADFKKEEKHRVLLQKSQGKKLLTYKGREQFKVTYQLMMNKRGPDGRRIIENGKVVREPTGEEKTMITSMTEVFGETKRESFCSTIWFDDPHVPNRFWYCCPKNCIKADEVPEYAGLMYYENGRFTKIKNAPLIHKEKRNLSQVLLDKFYHKYLYSR